MRKFKRLPIIGSAFDCDQRNEGERIESYVAELRYYRPRGFSKLTKEGERLARSYERESMKSGDSPFDHSGADILEAAHEWKSDVEEMLTSWARRVARHDFISFGPFPDSGDVGFSIDVDSAIGEADFTVDYGSLRLSDPAPEMPKGFSGMYVEISDHGNVSAYQYSRGRKTRELFAVV